MRTFTVGLSRLIQLWMLFVPSLRPLESVFVWYANLPEIRTDIYLAGIIFGQYSSAHLSMPLERRSTSLIITHDRCIRYLSSLSFNQMP
jgi:hypothetical protein